MSYESILVLCMVGALGALFRDVVADGKISMPKRTADGLTLGFLGSMFVGGVIGWLADNSPVTAFCAGFAGFSTLSALIPSKKVTDATLTDTTAVGPVANATVYRPRIYKPFVGEFAVTQKFGENPSWYKPSGYAGHFGIDYLTPWGTSIRAVDQGIVSRVGFTNGNGNFIEIQHAWGYSLYLHFMEPSTCMLGMLVKAKQTIGYAGNTGAVKSSLPAETPHRGTHLHFSIKINGIENKPYKNFVDPTKYFI